MRIDNRDSYEYKEQKPRENLRQDDRQRHRRNKDRRKRRQKQWEEDIVKTGSEDEETDEAITYRNRHKKSLYKLKSKEEKNTYVGIKERQDRLKRYMEQLHDNYTADQSSDLRREGVHNVRKIARQRQKELGKRKSKVSQPENIPPQRFYNTGAFPNESRIPPYSFYKPGAKETSDSGGGTSDDQVREFARHKRASILNRAEHLLRTVNHQSELDSYSDRESKFHSRVTQLSDASNRTYTMKKEELKRNREDDNKYVLVSTIVSPEPPEIEEQPYAAVQYYDGYKSQFSNKSLPSRIQVNNFL